MGRGLAGKRILVVEDEYLIASDLARALAEAEATVIGPVPDVRGGLALAADTELDGALLDLNLAGTSSLPIAAQLRARDVPYMFLSGYDSWSLPDEYRAIPHLPKPAPITSVLRAMQDLVTAGEAE